ncbi:hypothetical protein SAMN05216327_101274 [Dyadobacter sp. SG02]|uniref:hypothetical protein n=1 Tax=Dyadobacter sp. SG02 TaxID=1855291 RepID=UPI0008B6812D|nr:hypothetical protein [Dyadobacter sp. SG02]SEI40351.1 hypothetical protein SAMN05216327_101274 [Dyadobacter sp. SG02]
MLLQDENLDLIDVDSLKKEIERDLPETPVLTEDEIEDDLAEMYLSASNVTASLYYNNEKIAALASTRARSFAARRAGRGILKKIRDFICRFLNEGSTTSDIIDKILEALASILPGGVIIKFLVKKIVKFVLNRGIGAFCRVA